MHRNIFADHLKCSLAACCIIKFHVVGVNAPLLERSAVVKLFFCFNFDRFARCRLQCLYGFVADFYRNGEERRRFIRTCHHINGLTALVRDKRHIQHTICVSGFLVDVNQVTRIERVTARLADDNSIVLVRRQVVEHRMESFVFAVGKVCGEDGVFVTIILISDSSIIFINDI